MSLKIKKTSLKAIITLLLACQMTIPFFLGAQWADAVTPDMEWLAIASAVGHALLLGGLVFLATADLKE